jgi:hypothetical protein
MLGGSYTRATSTFVVDMNTIVLLAVGRSFSQLAEHVRQKRIGSPATCSASYPTSALAQIDGSRAINAASLMFYVT